jgi:hypothetical protein
MGGAVVSVRMEPPVKDNIIAVRKNNDQLLAAFIIHYYLLSFPANSEFKTGLSSQKNQIVQTKCIKCDVLKFIF